jgi:hypothetical protein
MTNRRTFLLLAAAAATSGLRRANAQRPAVRVTREEPVITRTDFDPRRPPADMPPLTPPESGACKTTFELAAGVSYSAERLAGGARIYVDGLEIATKLRIDIFTALDSPAKLRAHEEGHRAIGEHYYRSSGAIAEDIGRRLIGRSYEGQGADDETAQRAAFGKVVAELERAYMARVRVPSAAANERFDEITNHGLASIDEGEAIALALAPR